MTAPLITSLPSLASLQRSARMSHYRANPVEWVNDVLGEFLWSKQREIANALVHHHKVAVPSCFASGKSFLASRLAVAWIANHPPGEAFVVTCYDDQTEVLTRDGWKLFADVRIGPDGDLFATRNHDTKQFEWQHAHNYHTAPWDGEMVRVKGRSVDLLVTPNHRMLTQWAEYRDGAKITGETIKRADAITARGAELPAKSVWTGSSPATVTFGNHTWDSATFAAFMGMWLADGSLGPARIYKPKTNRKSSAKNPPAGVINITRPPGTKGYEEFRAILTHMLGHEPCYSSNKTWSFACSDLYHYLLPLGTSHTKFIPAALLDWSTTDLKTLLNHYLLGDGHTQQSTRRGGGVSWRSSTVSRELADDLQEVAQKVGISATITPKQPSDCRIEGRHIPASRQRVSYHLNYNMSDVRSVNTSREHYVGNVYCVSVPNEILYVRSRSSAVSSPVWCGNTASTAAQVKAILWREMGRAFEKAGLPGRMNQTEWHMTMPNGREELVAYGRKPADMDSTGFQGIHSPFVLVIIDEAAGVKESLYEGAEALVVNADSRILAIGNPEDSNSEFYNICKPGSGWHVVRIPASSTPNFTGEPVPHKVAHQLISTQWVEHKRRKWGEDNPMWIAKVLAEFPEVNEFGLIPISWVRAAQERSIPFDAPNTVIEMGVDVGGGGNKSVITLRRGNHARVIRRDTNPDTMVVADNVAADITAHQPTLVKVDMIGIGRGVIDRLKQLGKGVALGVNVSVPANDDTAYANLRAEGYWHLRTLFQDGLIDIDPDDDDLAAQLIAIKYKRSSNGRIAIESKDEIRARGSVSPDEADSLMLAMLNPKGVKRKSRGTWGRRTHSSSPTTAVPVNPTPRYPQRPGTTAPNTLTGGTLVRRPGATSTFAHVTTPTTTTSLAPPRPVLHSTPPARKGESVRGKSTHGGEIVNTSKLPTGTHRVHPRELHARLYKSVYSPVARPYLGTDNNPTSHPDGTPQSQPKAITAPHDPTTISNEE